MLPAHSTSEHGRNVGVYFKFLRWSLTINVLLSLMWILFLILPYSDKIGFSEATHAINHADEPEPEPTIANFFTGIISGAGPFLSSAFFYGSYSLPIVVPPGEPASLWSAADGRDQDPYEPLTWA